MKWGNDRRVRPAARPAYGRPTPPPSKRRSGPHITINARALVALILVVMVTAWWWQFFRVARVTVSGSRLYSSGLVTNEVNQELSSHPLWHNLTILDTRALRRDILSTGPQLADVTIRRQWPAGLNLIVTERKPNLIWSTGGKRYLLDGQGVIITPAGDDNGSKLVTVEDTTGLGVKVGQKVVPAAFVAFCGELINQVPAQTGLAIKELQVPETTSEVYLMTPTYYIKFDTTRSATSEVGDLVRVLAQLKRQNKSPAQYIDLRVEDRAYYQ